ncbi:two-component system, response regulator [Caballeronia pedi]|uniref:Two-component system, response regulator n=1 Tax=Caballeronia pedi TaxID=1777141 RepID=A0A158C7E1_9BURK|nr:response regulator [Caballeronia pedi]SAK78212.1 two-component system, response regulator [Caballeronia pedi]
MKREDKIKIVMADDRPVVLYGLQSWFESHERFQVAACVKTADQLFARLNAAHYDVIVLGSGLEGSRADDFALLRALRRTFPDTPVVVFTDETDAQALADMLRADAAGIVSAREEARAFERVCARVVSGAHEVVSQRIAGYRDAEDAADSSEANPDYCGVRMNVRTFIARS